MDLKELTKIMKNLIQFSTSCDRVLSLIFTKYEAEIQNYFAKVLLFFWDMI